MQQLYDRVAMFAQNRVRKNQMDPRMVATALIERGLLMFEDADQREYDGVIVRIGEDHNIGIIPVTPATALQHRVDELLDFASCYGAYDENTPNGTASKNHGGGDMNDYRRVAIVLLKKLRGDLPVDFMPTFPDLVPVIREAAQMFNGYAVLHLAKTPPDIDKADRNARMAFKLYESIGVSYLVPEMPQEAAREPQEADSRLPAPETPAKVSTAALDRKEVLSLIDGKLDGCTKAGMSDAYNVLRALRDELAQHLEEAPVDIYRALTAIIRQISDYNWHKGWWSDTTTDLRTCSYSSYVMASKMFLVVTEMGEAMEGHRKSSKTKILMDDHLPERPMVEVEFADALIRLFDLGGNYRLPNGGLIDVPGAVVEKLAYNDRREDHKKEVRAAEGGKTI